MNTPAADADRAPDPGLAILPRPAAGARPALRGAELVDLVPAVIYVFDLEERRSVFLNRFSTSLLGHTSEEILALGPDFLSRALHPDDVPALTAHLGLMGQLPDGVPASFEYRLRHRDGSWRWFLGHDVVFARDDDGRVRQVLGVAAEITDRKESEQVLARSEAELRTLFSSIDEGFCLCELLLDEQGLAVDYRYLSVNPLFEEMTGLRGVSGRTARELMPGLRPSWIEAYSRVGLDGESLRFEVESEATGRWFEVFSVPMRPRGRFATVFRDQTERHRAELALRENEATERSGRLRAERVAALLSELGSIEGARHRVKRLVEFLAGELSALASVEISGARGTEGGARLRVPVDLGIGVRGTVVLRITDPARGPFGPDDEAFVREVADRAGLVLSRASLLEEEHKVSLRLQRALLPDALRQHPDVVIDAHYEAASTLLEVGGDWYDTFSWPQGQIGVMVGDVIGHDLQAAVAMGRLRAGVGALVTQVPPSPAAVIEALDRCVHGPDGAEFVTACALVVDPRRRELRYSRAGHPPALLVPPTGEATWLDGALSTPVSDLAVDRRPEAAVRLEPGAVVILFSDGLIERRGESLGAGLDRLQRVAVQLVVSGEPDLASQLAAALAEDSTPEDDVVVVTVRYRPGH